MYRAAFRLFFSIIFFINGSPDARASTAIDSTRLKKWFVPHYVPIQFAGNIGLISTGLGYTSDHENYQLSILYGYVPASVAQTRVHMLTAKNMFPLTRYALRNNQTLIPYAGLGLTLEIGGISFFKMPSHYPDSYYDFPKNLHVLAFGGVRMEHIFQDDVAFLRGMELYAEAGTVDVYIWYKAISNEIKFRQIFNLAFGVNLLLRP